MRNRDKTFFSDSLAGARTNPHEMDPTTTEVVSDGQRTDITQPDLAKTGVFGLDQILNGGLPRNHIYLIDGQPGTGKTARWPPVATIHNRWVYR